MRLPSLLTATILACLLPLASAADCRDVARDFASRYGLDQTELASTLAGLSRDGRLPPRYVSKRDAQRAGWRPGSDLWQVLPGKSIGGDRFGNREGRLPAGRYSEADLDYRGGKRNAKRLVFSHETRYLTVDHYASFHEIPPCR
ncbi:ribonuclease domain-containing protein [Chitinilyticum piscinae]|uniref:Ribonuclease n=1 Tax=Chitinilyticum piscinae TaxID=2866724 RepID=A0A8J7FIH1_9NEIS|nr:ribonuclease domain-containing protein [Chitinilyticum piscinae]MBE9608790.1 ribonuclease [Chitinilyticum piscinae]